jgi:hypothetical protein
MPVYRVLDELTYEELLGWYAYFQKRPPGWREDDRAAKMIQAQGAKMKPWEIFPSLKAIYHPAGGDGRNDNGLSSLRGSLMFHKMLSAKGGDKLDFSEGQHQSEQSD